MNSYPRIPRASADLNGHSSKHGQIQLPPANERLFVQRRNSIFWIDA